MLAVNANPTLTFLGGWLNKPFIINLGNFTALDHCGNVCRYPTLLMAVSSLRTMIPIGSTLKTSPTIEIRMVFLVSRNIAGQNGAVHHKASADQSSSSKKLSAWSFTKPTSLKIYAPLPVLLRKQLYGGGARGGCHFAIERVKYR